MFTKRIHVFNKFLDVIRNNYFADDVTGENLNDFTFDTHGEDEDQELEEVKNLDYDFVLETDDEDVTIHEIDEDENENESHIPSFEAPPKPPSPTTTF